MLAGRMAGVAAVVVATILVGGTWATAESPPPPDCNALTPFTAEVDAELARRYPGHRITAAVYDQRTGCTFALRPGERNTTASVLKVELYAGILLRAQREGRWLTPSEAAGAWPMITESANPPASAFFASLGGIAGVDALSRDTFGMVDTRAASPWGLTVTSAADQIHLLRQVLLGEGGVLHAPYRQALLDAMQAVVPSQRWGVSAGVPPGWMVALKNGFAPSRCCGWRTNSVGFVRPPNGGPGYLVAILTDGWPDEPTGILAVELVSRVIAGRLAHHPYVGFASPGAFVDAVHADVAGAAPSVPTWLWLTASAGWDGAAAGPLVDGLLGVDASGRGDLVGRLVRGLLDRRPDLSTLEHWKGVVRARGVAGMADALLASAEVAAATAGLDHGAFVRWAYERLLGRAPDAGGAAHWTGEVVRRGRGAVLVALASSAEATARLGHEAMVVQVYDALLRRLPSDNEIAGWAGRTRAAVAAAVVASGEYPR